GSSTLDKAFDDNMSTHFETGKPNSTSFTNEIVVTFEDEKTIDRIVYAARQSSAKGKGFAKNVEIYASSTEGEDDFRLVSTGEYSGSVGDIVEIKFKPTEFKRLKFVFKEANQEWASASELWFYEEDKVSDMMEDLFTDSSKYEINEKYNDIDIINELESEIQNHPFRDNYIEDIELAKKILTEGITGSYSESKIKVSTIAQSKDIKKYDDVYKISTSEFKSVTNNGGHYGQSVLTNLYDGDKTTHWETKTSNSDSFKNEVEFTFKSIQEIEKIILAPRQNASNKGFPLEYEIYGALSDDSADYKLITRGTSNSALSVDGEIVFEAAKFKKLKFKFINAYNGMAGLGEMSFYTKDEVTPEVNKVFTDNMHTKVSEEYDSLEEIALLEEKVLNHPLKDDYMEILNAAKSIIGGDESAVSKTITLSQRGDENVKKAELRQIFAGGNLDVTGFYVMPGESFEVYVDADTNAVMPQLVFSQVGEVDGAGNHRKSLGVGKNVLTAPSGSKGFAIYFANKALPEEQSYAPIVKIAGENLKSYPVYIHGETDPAEYIETVKNHTGANM
ncbi:MAG: discoidin domain-containing protein, partial [Clostridium sp.]|nr:discoidin domain-containing protein [Clostridium sp.]